MKKILFVEDNEKNYKEFEVAFGRKYDIFNARTVHAAIDLIKDPNKYFDLFVLDANLPYEENENAEDFYAWHTVFEKALECYGEGAKQRTVIRTANTNQPEATGQEVASIAKNESFKIVDEILNRCLEPIKCQPNVLLVGPFSPEMKEMERLLKLLGAKVEKCESSINAIKLLKENKSFYHYFIVDLKAADDDKDVPLPTSYMPESSKLQAGLKVVSIIRQYSPLSLISTVYPIDDLCEGLSQALTHFDVDRVYVKEDRDISTFIANCWGSLRKEMIKLECLGERLETDLIPIHPSVINMASLYTGSRNKPLIQTINSWVNRSSRYVVLIITSSSLLTSNSLLSAIHEIFTQRGEACAIIDFEGLTTNDALEHLSHASEILRLQEKPPILVLRNLTTLFLEEIINSNVFNELRFTKKDLRIIASSENDQETKVRELFEDGGYSKFSHTVQLPIINDLSIENIKTLVQSFLLAYGTYYCDTEIILDKDFIEFIKDTLGGYTARELWPLLKKIFNNRNNLSSIHPIFDKASGREAYDKKEDSWETKELPRFSVNYNIEVDDEHKDIVQALFQGYREIDQCSPLSSTGMSGAKLYLVRPWYCPPGAPKPFQCPNRIVKVNTRRKIQVEYQNYKTWVEPLQDKYVTRILDEREKKRLGALSYWFVNKSGGSEQLMEFRRLFLRKETKFDQIKSVIDWLFQNVLVNNWYHPSAYDSDQKGYNWFYGKHLPPLLEVKISSKEDIYKAKDLDKTSGDGRGEVLRILKELQEPAQEVDGTLLHLGSLVIPYEEERDEKKTIITTHSCGAEIEIISDLSFWDGIEKHLKGTKGFAIAVKGIFTSSQREIIASATRNGFVDIGWNVDFTQKIVSIQGIPFKNPLFYYQSFLFEKQATKQLLGIIHGDLHWKNVLVDTAKSTQPKELAWLIDFGHTGYGPLIFDAIELEVDLLVSVLPQMGLDNHEEIDFSQIHQILKSFGKNFLCKDLSVLRNGDTDIKSRALGTINCIRENIANLYLPRLNNVENTINAEAYYKGMCILSLGLLRHFRNDKQDPVENKLQNIKRRICFIIAATVLDYLDIDSDYNATFN
jgi:hypothetical protein